MIEHNNRSRVLGRAKFSSGCWGGEFTVAFFQNTFVNCVRNVSTMYSKVKKYARKNVVAFVWR